MTENSEASERSAIIDDLAHLALAKHRHDASLRKEAEFVPDTECGCGKPVRYQVPDSCGRWACNKYGRCSSREELLLQVEEMRAKLYEAKKYCNELLNLKQGRIRDRQMICPYDVQANFQELWQFVNTLPN